MHYNNSEGYEKEEDIIQKENERLKDENKILEIDNLIFAAKISRLEYKWMKFREHRHDWIMEELMEELEEEGCKKGR